MQGDGPNQNQGPGFGLMRQTAMPRHVAIIMDGNGRWATARGLPRFEGHRRGVEALRRAVRIAGDMGIEVLTVYAFSSENWRRPKSEIAELMGLLKLFVRRDLAELHRNNVRVRSIGERDSLAPDLRGLIEEAENLTQRNTSLTLVIAFNYGARDEIARAVRTLAAAVAAGKLAPDAITDGLIGEALDAPDMPDPDLIIRTSGEQRLSNFLLWQAAYSEFVFLPVLWPDFDRTHFEQALEIFAKRERRFGGVELPVQVGVAS
jgi:undecaprenyl diphosphate synthase